MYVLAIVYSHWTLAKVFDFLVDYLDAERGDIAIGKIERYYNSKDVLRDSNRSLLLMAKTLFDKGIQAGLNLTQSDLDFRMEEYIISAKHYPTLGYCGNFFIRFPIYLSPTDAHILIEEKMNVFVSTKFIQRTEYTLRIPLASRITGQHQGFAIVIFLPQVSMKTRTMIRCLLHQSFLYLRNDVIEYLSVSWLKSKV